MSGPAVEFTPGHELFYTNKGQKKMFALLGVRTYNQFMALFRNPDGLDNEQLEKMVLAGLIWKKEHENITLEEVQTLIDDEYYIKLGKNFEDFNNVIIDALTASGLWNKKAVEEVKKKEAAKQEEDKEIKEEVQQGEDKGE
jgi:hypothetical protein